MLKVLPDEVEVENEEHPCCAVIGSVCRFLMVLTENTLELGIDISDKEIDHVCYRCATVKEYIKVCKELQRFGVLLLESMIGGRPISMIFLTDPMKYRQWRVRCIEVTCPKAGRFHQAGLEHAEVVIGSPADGIHHSKPLLETFKQKHPAVQFDEKAIDKEVNADISIPLLGGSMSVKFHSRPIYEVIEEEVRTGSVVPVPANYFSEALKSEQDQVGSVSAGSSSSSPAALTSRLAGTKAMLVFPPPAASDIEIAALLSDPAAMEHLAAMSMLDAAGGGGWSEGEAAQRRLRQSMEFSNGTSLNGAIYISEVSGCELQGNNDEQAAQQIAFSSFAGIGGFRSIDWWNRSAEMGIILSPSCWRRGLCAEVHLLCLRYAFETLCLNRIQFKTASTNTAMIGFCKEVLHATHEGTLRDAFPAKHTSDTFRSYCNVELFSILACEWSSIKVLLLQKSGSRK